MKIDILTLFPEMFDGFLNTSIIKRAIDKQLVDITLHNFREYTHDKHKHVDDYPYDYIIGSVHFVKAGDKYLAVDFSSDVTKEIRALH